MMKLGTNVLVEDDHVAGCQSAFAPRLSVGGHARLSDRRKGAIEDSPVAAEGVRLQHRLKVAQTEIGRAHV